MPRIELKRLIVPRSKTSLVMHVPAWEIPLIKAKWTPFVDSGARFEIRAIPAIFQSARYRDVPSCEDEQVRLADQYRDHKGNTLFHQVYPGNTFADAYQQVLSAQGLVAEVVATQAGVTSTTPEAAELEEVELPPSDDLTALNHVGPKTAKAMIDAGFRTFGDVARADRQKLLDVDGVGETRIDAIMAEAKTLI